MTTLGRFKGFDMGEYIRPTRAKFVHKNAEVSGCSKIGDGSKVWQFASVIRGSKLGQDCSIGDCAIVDGAKLGNGVIVSHGAFIDPGVEIGDEVFIGPNVSLCNDGWPRADKVGWDIGPLLDGFVTIRVGNKASIGANAVVLPGITIGGYSMIAAGAVVDRDVPPNHLFKRDGSMVLINDFKPKNRMRRAGA